MLLPPELQPELLHQQEPPRQPELLHLQALPVLQLPEFLLQAAQSTSSNQ